MILFLFLNIFVIGLRFLPGSDCSQVCFRMSLGCLTQDTRATKKINVSDLHFQIIRFSDSKRTNV